MLYSSTYKTGYKGAVNTLAALIITTKVVAIMTDSNVSNSVEQGKEIWKDIEGYDGIYQVSNKGNVRSWRKRGRVPAKARKPRILSLTNDGHGYPKLTLYNKHREPECKKIHRLVAEAFIPNPHNKKEVNHIDCDKSNSSVKNIEWVTSKENSEHAVNNGRFHKISGANNKDAKLTKNEVLEIRAAYKLGCFTQKEIGNAYGVRQDQISRIVNRKRWTHI